MTRALFTFFVFLLSFDSFSQHLNFIHYNSNNSLLPHNVVYSVNQSSDGYLWINTDDGLIRFDGQQMKAFDQGLSSRYTISLAEDRGQLWLATWRGGIHRLQNRQWIPMPSEIPQVTNSNRLIVSDSLFIIHYFRDYVFMQLSAGGDRLEWANIKGLSTKGTIYSPGKKDYFLFLKRKNGDVLAYTRDQTGLIQKKTFEIKTKKGWHLLYENAEGKLFGLRASTIYALSDDLTKEKAICTLSDTLLPEKDIAYFLVLATGSICLGTEPLAGKPAHFLFNPQTGQTINLIEGVRNLSPIASVFADREGSLW